MFFRIIGFFAFLITAFSRDIKICLSMVIENDEQNIAECLESVQDLVDCIAIYDVGSTDRTTSIIKEFLTKTKIPGNIYQHEGNELDNHQTLAMKLARAMIENYQWSLKETYILLIEPNMILKREADFHKNCLNNADSFFLLEKSNYFFSYDVHLFLSELAWENHLIYPYWSSSKPHKSLKCNSLSLVKQPDLNQAIQRLRKTLAKQESSERYLFNLAKAYQEINQYEMAIEFYQQRLKTKGDPEECWFSKYMIGECFENLQKWDKALYWYLESYHDFPDRSEPLAKIATHYRKLGQNDLAYIFAKFGSCIPLPNNQIHFTSSCFEPYQLDEELSIVSYYTPFKADGYKAASDLVLKRNVPDSVRVQTYRNLVFYVEPLERASYYPIEMDLPWIQGDIYYKPMNPSILKTEDGYSVICRTVNYTQKGARDFQVYDQDGIYKSRNFLLKYDGNFNLLSQKELIEESFRKKIGFRNMQGLDDCRIFEWKQSLWFTCTTTDTNPTDSVQISLCKTGDIHSKEYAPVESVLPLQGPDPYRCEKNWLPFVEEDQLYLIYQYDPFVIYVPDLKDGGCKCIYSYEPLNDFSSFRGSAGPISFNDGYLILIHEVVSMPDFQRVYLHRFVFLNRDWRITQVSKAFIFKHIGVEYCCGMTIDHSGDKLILSIGIEDKEALLCRIDCEMIQSMLASLPKSD